MWERNYARGDNVLAWPCEDLVMALGRYARPSPEARVLEIGFGAGNNLRHLVRLFREVYGCEVSPSALSRAQSALDLPAGRLELFDGYVLPYPDEAFDCIVCWHVTEYLEPDRMQEFFVGVHRILKPGGRFFCTFVTALDNRAADGELLGPNRYATAATNTTQARVPINAYDHPDQFRHMLKGFEMVCEGRSYIDVGRALDCFLVVADREGAPIA